MKVALMILVVALIAKDTSQLNDPYVMRGVAQGLCLLLGGIWIMANLTDEILKRYWAVFGYVAAISLSSLFSGSLFYILLQVASLVAILFFFIAYFETSPMLGEQAIGRLIDTTVICYSIVAILSLIVIFTHPAIAYGAMNNGNAGVEYRFRGLFPKSGMLASAAGVTMGMIWFSGRRTLVKWAVVVVCGACVAMTLSRTFWIGVIVAGVATYWVYAKQSRRWLVLLICLAIPLGYGLKVLDLGPDVSNAKYLRVETITNLTGRVSLWEQGLAAFYRSPYLGYGYTAGASGLAESGDGNGSEDIDAGRDVGRTTLHSGYLQSLLDSGVTGTLFYLAIIAVAIIRITRRHDSPYNRAVFFGLVFFAVSNATQNVIYSASVFDSVLFFGLAIYAMGPRRPDSGNETSHEPLVYPDMRYKSAAGEN